MNSKANCATCAFNKASRCHRYPPTLGSVGFGAAFPYVDASTGGCGEWKYGYEQRRTAGYVEWIYNDSREAS